VHHRGAVLVASEQRADNGDAVRLPADGATERSDFADSAEQVEHARASPLGIVYEVHDGAMELSGQQGH